MTMNDDVIFFPFQKVAELEKGHTWAIKVKHIGNLKGKERAQEASLKDICIYL